MEREREWGNGEMGRNGDLPALHVSSFSQLNVNFLILLPFSLFSLFPHSAYVKIFVTFATKVLNFNILQQNVTNFYVGSGERMRKWREREEMERE